MLLIFFRAIILYIVVFLVMRLMGKREISQLQPFEFVVSMIIANLATVPMSEVGIPLLNGIIPIVSLLFMHLILTIITLKSMKLRKILCRRTTNYYSQRKNNRRGVKKRINDIK